MGKLRLANERITEVAGTFATGRDRKREMTWRGPGVDTCPQASAGDMAIMVWTMSALVWSAFDNLVIGDTAYVPRNPVLTLALLLLARRLGLELAEIAIGRVSQPGEPALLRAMLHHDVSQTSAARRAARSPQAVHGVAAIRRPAGRREGTARSPRGLPRPHPRPVAAAGAANGEVRTSLRAGTTDASGRTSDPGASIRRTGALVLAPHTRLVCPRRRPRCSLEMAAKNPHPSRVTPGRCRAPRFSPDAAPATRACVIDEEGSHDGRTTEPRRAP